MYTDTVCWYPGFCPSVVRHLLKQQVLHPEHWLPVLCCGPDKLYGPLRLYFAPLLFSMYMLPLASICKSPVMSLHCYADDTVLFSTESLQ